MPGWSPQANEIFLNTVEITAVEERRVYVESACQGDGDLRQAVEALLHARTQAGSFLSQPAGPPVVTAAATPGLDESAAPAADAAAGTCIAGRYRLLQPLGEGGMGAVWVAEQSEPVQRRVALKLIKPGMDSAQVLRRFEAERQALALMDHTNIAKVFDAGTTDAGRPYFVMELVKGVPITKYCDTLHLPIRERLSLFVSVCQAIQHAHQKGIIHRDIKPSNVLVCMQDGKPVAKVIDFGVAKALHQKLAEQPLFTEIGQIVGTLEYMSPEQAELSALDIDTRADVYALGVLLYELLTGTTPLDKEQLRGAAFTEMLRLIREVDPPRPSTRLTESKTSLASLAAQRRSEPLRLTREVRGELDWIVMKALEKDRTRRYETANGLARDVERYLHDEPVEACPPASSYRLKKFARKHRRLLATAAAFLLLLVLGVVVSMWLAVRATQAEGLAHERLEQVSAEQTRTAAALAAETRARQQTRAALSSMTDDVIEKLFARQTQLGDNEKAFLGKVLAFYQAFAADSGETEEARAVAADGQFRVARLRAFLGETTAAVAGYREAVRLLEKLTADFPTMPAYRQQLAASHNNLGMALLELGQRPEAETAYRHALAILKKLAADFPTVPVYRQELANCRHNLGNLLIERGQWPEAETAHRQALAIREKLAADFPALPASRRDLARSHTSLGWLLLERDQRPQAELAFRRALAIQEKLVEGSPSDPECREDLAASHHNLAKALVALGQWPKAETAYRQALAIFEKLAADFPTVPAYRQKSAASLTNLGNVLRKLGQQAEGETAYRQARAMREKLVADFPTVPAYRTDLAGSDVNLGNLLLEQGRALDALEWYAKAIPPLHANLAQDPRLATERLFLRNAHWNRARALTDLKRYPEALKDWDRTIELDDGSQRGWFRLLRAVTLAHVGNHARAVAEADDVTADAKTPGAWLYGAAIVNGLSMTAVQASTPLKEHYARTAIALLRRARASGYFQDARMVESLQNDDGLVALRGRADFQAFVAELAKELLPRREGSPIN